MARQVLLDRLADVPRPAVTLMHTTQPTPASDSSQSVKAAAAGSGRSCASAVAGFRVTDAEFGSFSSTLHEHEHTLCSIAVAGGWRQSFVTREFDCHPGAAVIKSAGVRHRDHFERAGSRLLLIEIEPWRQEELEDCGVSFEKPRLVRQPFVAALSARLLAELAQADPATPLAVEALLLEFFARTSRCRSESPTGEAPRWLRAARDWLDANFHQPVSFAELARIAGVSPVRLARAFRKHHGVTIGEYVRETRLRWVSLQLMTSEAPLATLALRAGFADQSHLNRWFRRLLGTTPARYRATARPGLAPRDGDSR